MPLDPESAEIPALLSQPFLPCANSDLQPPPSSPGNNAETPLNLLFICRKVAFVSWRHDALHPPLASPILAPSVRPSVRPSVPPSPPSPWQRRVHILEKNFIRNLLWAAFQIHANLIRCLWGLGCLIELESTNGSEDLEWAESSKTECVLSDNYTCFAGIDLYAFFFFFFPPLLCFARLETQRFGGRKMAGTTRSTHWFFSSWDHPE